MDDLIYTSATSLARAVRDRKVSAEELVKAYLRRIEEVNPKLNAVVQLTAESALAQARAADAALSHGESVGALHGVPITIKDSLDTAGVITTWGVPARKRHVPAAHATVVARLKAAGAILLGKTNTPELTLSVETDNLVYGRTNNPFDVQRTPGGSSGGAAAIVAAGGSSFDLGSDTGGSIRTPSHFCGTAGIRPTSGRVPRTGHAIPAGGLLDSLTQIGPIARFVEDLVTILPLIAGVDGRDPYLIPMLLRDPSAVNLKGMRGAFYVDNGIRAPTQETANTVRAAVQALSTAGVGIEEKSPPGVQGTLGLFGALLTADGGAWLRLLLERAESGTGETSLGPLLSATPLEARDLVHLVDRWDSFRSNMLSFMEPYDMVLSPVNAAPAPPHGQGSAELGAFSYPMTYNLTGWPVAVVRAGTSPEGLPIGVQIASRPWREDVALAAAACLERALGGWQRPPL